jgi:hypothetical protein
LNIHKKQAPQTNQNDKNKKKIREKKTNLPVRLLIVAATLAAQGLACRAETLKRSAVTVLFVGIDQVHIMHVNVVQVVERAVVVEELIAEQARRSTLLYGYIHIVDHSILACMLHLLLLLLILCWLLAG